MAHSAATSLENRRQHEIPVSHDMFDVHWPMPAQCPIQPYQWGALVIRDSDRPGGLTRHLLPASTCGRYLSVVGLGMSDVIELGFGAPDACGTFCAEHRYLHINARSDDRLIVVGCFHHANIPTGRGEHTEPGERSLGADVVFLENQQHQAIEHARRRIFLLKAMHNINDAGVLAAALLGLAGRNCDFGGFELDRLRELDAAGLAIFIELATAFGGDIHVVLDSRYVVDLVALAMESEQRREDRWPARPPIRSDNVS